ncbi:MAG: Ferripyoverdine receptor precursor [Verrucomicrobiota bacterium]|jgi:iron complex outermembrane receptor protein
MKPTKHIALMAGWIALALAPAHAQTAPAGSRSVTVAASEKPLMLPEFTVNTTADRGYRAANSISATRIETSIAELPFSISAFTEQFIADIGARELFDVVRYSAGVNSGSSEYLAGNANFSIRGFKQYPQHDGFYESTRGNIYVDTASIERVEVVKGPASLLFGAISPGGTVNYITKHAQAKPFTTIGLRAGSLNFHRATLDINRPLVADTVLMRFNAAYEQGYQLVDGQDTRTTIINPTVTWKLSPRLSARVNFQWFQRDESPPAFPRPQMQIGTPASIVGALNNPGYPGAASLLQGRLFQEPGFGSNGADPGALGYYPFFASTASTLADTDRRYIDLKTFSAELHATLSDNWKSRFNFNYNRAFVEEILTGGTSVIIPPPNSLVFANGAWSVAPGWAALTTQQQIDAGLAFARQLLSDPKSVTQSQNGTPSPAVQSHGPLDAWQKNNTRSLQWEVVGNVKLAGVIVRPLVGLFYDESGSQTWVVQNSGNAASPNFRTWDLNPTSPTFYINRSSSAFQSAALTRLATSNHAWTSNQAAYGIVNARFFDERFLVTGGARYNRSQSQTTNYIAAAGANPVGRGFKTDYTSPQVGVGYKLLPSLMLYASYSTSYVLPSTPFLQTIQTVNGALTSVPTTQAEPTTSKGYEVGVKTNFLDGRVSSTFSAFKIKQENVVQTVTQIINGLSLASSKSEGLELETNISVINNLQLFLSGSIINAYNSREPAGYGYYLNQPPVMHIRVLGNVWARYNFTQSPLKGLWVGAGVNYNGRQPMAAQNRDLYAAPYRLWNSVIGYDFNLQKSKVSVTLNGENLTNADYSPAPQVRGFPRRALLSISTTF